MRGLSLHLGSTEIAASCAQASGSLAFFWIQRHDRDGASARSSSISIQTTGTCGLRGRGDPHAVRLSFVYHHNLDAPLEAPGREVRHVQNSPPRPVRRRRCVSSPPSPVPRLGGRPRRHDLIAVAMFLGADWVVKSVMGDRAVASLLSWTIFVAR